MIGTRIKLVREILGKTQEELGEMIGTTQSGVASMESGIYRPSPDYLRTIANETGFTLAFFDKEEAPDFPFGSMLYRAQASVRQSLRTKAHAMAHVAFECAVGLASRLKPIPINIPKLEETSDKAAQITRASLGLSPNNPIKGLLGCLERNGVLVFSIPMEVAGFDGFSAWAGHDPSRPVIALLRGKTAFREVFTIAEELAHLVMHFPLRIPTKEADKQARAFAQEFLLPSDAMLSEMQPPVTLSTLAAMKPRWGVSIAFLAKRSESLGLITSNQHRYLIQQMQSKWGTKSEPGDENAWPERPKLVRKMAELLYGNPIAFGKMSKDSGLPVPMLRDFLGVEQSTARLLEFRAKQS